MTASDQSKKLAILGASGHGLVVAESAERLGKWKMVEFYDDDFPQKQENQPFPVSGTIKQASKLDPMLYDFALGIGDNNTRFKVGQALHAANLTFATIIDPNAIISKYAHISAGSYIASGAIVNARASIGRFCIVNTHAVVEHDCVLSDATHVSPGATVGGTVSIGECTWIGIGACVRNDILIGAYCVVGAGSVVVSDIPDKTLAYGNPARKRATTC